MNTVNLSTRTQNIHGQVVLLGLIRDFTGHEPSPGFVALVDNFGSVLLVLGLAGESELILWLTIGDLVNPEGMSCYDSCST